MRKLLVAALTLAFALSSSLALGADEVPGIQGLQRYKLPNGLEVYAYRDAAVPLVRVQIAFRAGAIAQSADSAGLFRLYERMLFRGQSGADGSPGVKAALASLGVSDWNGGTGAERVDYWITLASSKVRQGIDFWAQTLNPDAIEKDAEGAAALETEKQALCEEIRSHNAESNSIYEGAIDRRLFSKYPWRRDPVGSEKAVSAATLDSLKSIAAYFVPNNAALFVGGDIDPEEVRAAAEAAFGAWRAGPDPWAKALPPNPRPGVVRPTWIVYPDPAMPEGRGRIEVRYRGPDLATDPGSSYTADLWSALVAPVSGRFKSALVKNVPRLNQDSIAASYISQRDGSWISLSSYFDVDPSLSAVSRAQAFKERVRGYELTTMKGDRAYFSDAEYEAARKGLLADRDMAADTADGMIETLAFWWTAASVDYYAGYPAALAKTGPKEVSAFVDTYILRSLEVVALRMNPADVEKEKRSFSNAGFETVTPNNAFWWQRKP
jgi:zinc protease